MNKLFITNEGLFKLWINAGRRGDVNKANAIHSVANTIWRFEKNNIDCKCLYANGYVKIRKAIGYIFNDDDMSKDTIKYEDVIVKYSQFKRCVDKAYPEEKDNDDYNNAIEHYINE